MNARTILAATCAAVLALLAGAPALAQLGLPPVGQTVGGVVDGTLGTVGRTLDPVTGEAEAIGRAAASLANARLERLDRLVRRNRDAIERDANGDPAVKGELLVVDPEPRALEAARAAGFAVAGEDKLGELGLSVTRLAVPAGMDLAGAQKRIEALMPGAQISADTLNFQAGGTQGAKRGIDQRTKPAIAASVGMIDGAPGASIPVAATRGFAAGAPAPSNHGSAVASLLASAGVRTIYVADVYGTDRAGGNALAIARGLDWLLGRGAKVVSISLVGPPNPLLARAVAAAQRKGAVVVAAVGNDGPAAPPSYPASYPGVLAITAVDGHDRALIEAGRALHIDYAAPGADMLAEDAKGRWRGVRGTSYATPLAAARAAAALDARGTVTATLDREAQRLSPAAAFGRGLLCATCRRTR
ncbi:MAG: S8 family serine peptidase [Sphingomonadales bacterium]|nr:S8 family serine peptidase [Sphingomonadales bacterium]MDE2569298.1 S8 family serine peptidase [Sphingomonadales bacterium]